MDVDRRRLLLAAVAALVLLSVAVAAATAVPQPRITAVDNEWGAVTETRTEVETRLTIANRTLLRIGERVATVRYTVSMNGIEVANETDRSVSVTDRGRTVRASTSMDNEEIPAWWVSHVGRNETTTVRVRPTITAVIAGVDLWRTSATQTQTVETDLLAPLRSDRRRTVRAFGRPVLVATRTDARWGNVTAARTPIIAEARVRNPTWLPLPVARLRYTIRMNGLIVGRGAAGGRTVVGPGETETIRARAAIDNAKLDEWWVTHLRRGERTRMTVDVHAIVEVGGQRRRIHLDALSSRHTFETDVLGRAENRGHAPGDVDLHGLAAVAREGPSPTAATDVASPKGERPSR